MNYLLDVDANSDLDARAVDTAGPDKSRTPPGFCAHRRTAHSSQSDDERTACSSSDPTRVTERVERLFYPEDGLDLPFTVANRPRVVAITVKANAHQSQALSDCRSYQWVHGVRGQVVVDLTAVPTVNSLWCCWLINLMRSASPAAMVVVGANKRVVETLRLLRLNTLIQIE